MKVVIVTPLYPPDIAEPAPYVKEVARRLSAVHEVVIVAYTALPEAVEGVRIRTVNRQAALLLRLLSFTRALLHEGRGADVLYMLNGPSVELPVALASLVRRTPVVIRFGDVRAHEVAQQRFLRHVLERIVIRHAKTVVEDDPLPRPEILPFEPYPEAAMTTYESSWRSHLALLTDVLTHAN